MIPCHCCHAKHEDSSVLPTIYTVTEKSEWEREREREWDLLGHSHDESIDATTLKDLSIRISKGSNSCLIIITTQHEMHLDNRSISRIFFFSSYFGLRSCIFAMTSEDNDLIEVSIRIVIVGQHRHTQLKSFITSEIGERERKVIKPCLDRVCLGNERRPAREDRWDKHRSQWDRWSCFAGNQHWRRHTSNSPGRAKGRDYPRTSSNEWNNNECDAHRSMVPPAKIISSSSSTEKCSSVTHRHSLGSPVVVRVEIVTARGEGSQLVVRREGHRRLKQIRQSVVVDNWTESMLFCLIEFSDAEHHRSMIGHLLIVDEVSVLIVASQI